MSRLDNSRFKIIVIASVVGLVVLCGAAVAIVAIVRGHDDDKDEKKEETRFKFGDEDDLSVNTTDLRGGSHAGKISAPGQAPSATTAAADVAKSPYGPFDSRQDLINYLEDYYRAVDACYGFERFIGDNIETNFGTAKKFTKSEYLQRMAKHNDKYNIIDSSRDYNWSSLKAEPLPDGGVKASYNSIYDMNTITDGEPLYRKFKLTTTVTINSRRQIVKYHEKTKKLDQW